MLKVQNKTTKRIRVAQIVFFLIQIYLTSTPFIWGGAIIPEYKQSTFTVLDMISFIGSTNNNAQAENALNMLGAIFILFVAIPVIALGFQLFDRSYNLKNIVGLICSFAGIMLIVFFIGGANICIGAIFALLLYLVTFFMSVMGIFARFLNQKNTAE